MRKHFLSICAIVKNEAPYIAEWLEFHRLQGVEHFYIYMNSAEGEDLETYAEIDKQRSKNEDITLRRWPGKAQQCTCYQDCLAEYGHESEWIAFVDCDEFICTVHPDRWSTLKDYLEAVVSWDEMSTPDNEYKDWRNTAGIAIHWMLFGSNGYKEKENGLVLERFTRRASSANNHVKSSMRPAYTRSVGNDPHTFLSKPGYHIRNERSLVYPTRYANSQRGETEVLVALHMHTKSFNEFVSRKSSSPDCNSGRAYSEDRIKEMFAAHDLNQVLDTSFRDRFASKIKEKVNGR